MTITLDDVSSIPHLLITGIFPSFLDMSNKIAKDLLIKLLGVTRQEAAKEMTTTRGCHVLFLWLWDAYLMHIEDDDNLDYAARAYMLHLVGTTLLADKSATYVDVVY